MNSIERYSCVLLPSLLMSKESEVSAAALCSSSDDVDTTHFDI